jgi:hypothetical protein
MPKHIDSRLVKTIILLILLTFFAEILFSEIFFLFFFSYQIDLHKKDGKWVCVKERKIEIYIGTSGSRWGDVRYVSIVNLLPYMTNFRFLRISIIFLEVNDIVFL